MDQVISVSSRESSPAQDRPARATRSSQPRPRPRPRPRRPLPAGDIIELTDSDSDDFPEDISELFRPQAKRAPRAKSKGKGKARMQPVAGPSRKRDEAPVAAAAEPASAPALAPVPAPVPAPAPQRVPSPPAQLPLFLPEFDAADFDAAEMEQFFNDPEPMPADAHDPPLDYAAPNPPAPPVEPEAPPVEAPVPEAPPEQAPMDAQDPYDAFVAQVLEIIPDVLPSHVYSLVEQHYPNYQDKVVEPVLHTLFENPGYPKANAKGKRKRDDSEERAGREVKPKIDYGDKNRKYEGGVHYAFLVAEQLLVDFPDIPVGHIRETLLANNMLYAPTFLALREHRTLDPLPYKAITRPRPKGKGKGVQQHDADFERELQWVRDKLEEEEAKKAAELAEEARLQEEGGIECGCCFSEYPFDKMIQCPEAHLFCTSCMSTYAETKLGEHDARIICMDQSGCKLPFPESELRRFLSPKLLDLYERVKQRKEIEAAGLANLEECPFCEYKVVIENEQERLFRCENEACGAVTCRQCKKPDHLPKSCQEVSDDKKLDVRHAIEEAMTAALMRNCPKCQKAFIKEMGCNKMTCPNCGALSCYVCRQLIVGYDHFGNPPPYTGKVDPKKCPLWDASVEGRHSDEVTAAAKAVIDEYKRTHPELDEKDLAVDLPPPPPAAGPSRAGAHAHAHAHHDHAHLLAGARAHAQARMQAHARFQGMAAGMGILQFGEPAHAHAHVDAAGYPQLEFVPALPPMPMPQEHRADLIQVWARQVERARGHRGARVRREVAAVPAGVHNVHVHIHHNQAPPPAPAPAPPLPPPAAAPVHHQVFYPLAHFPVPPALPPVPALPPIAGPANPRPPVVRAPVVQRRSKRVHARRPM